MRVEDAGADRLDAKLRELRAEYDAGQRMLADLDGRRAALMQTLLRIEGAIQVLVELGGEPKANGSAAP